MYQKRTDNQLPHWWQIKANDYHGPSAPSYRICSHCYWWICNKYTVATCNLFIEYITELSQSQRKEGSINCYKSWLCIEQAKIFVVTMRGKDVISTLRGAWRVEENKGWSNIHHIKTTHRLWIKSTWSQKEKIYVIWRIYCLFPVSAFFSPLVPWRG